MTVRGRLLVGATLLALVLGGCTGSVSAGTREAMSGPEVSTPQLTSQVPAPRLRWRRCPQLRGGVDPDTRGLRCAWLAVPLDYADPSGEQIRIAVSRRSGGADRPVLVSNPGGPGATGLFNTLGVDGATDGRLGTTFDLVSLDPRGVNLSAPVSCGLDATLVGANTGAAAPTTFEQDAERARETARRCAAPQEQRDLLEHVGTLDAVRDLEMLRRALRVESLSIVGTSYGADLALGYATLFPDHTAGVVLDSPTDSTRPWWQARRGAATTFADRFQQVADDVARSDDRFHLGATADAVQRRYLDLAAELQVRPRRVGGETVDAARLQSARLVPALEDPRQVEPLALTLQFLTGAEGAPTEEQLVAALGGDAAAGGPAPVNGQSLEQQVSASLAVRCADDAWPTSERYYRRAVAEEVRRTPSTRGQFSQISPCASWPSVRREPRLEVTDRGWTGTPNVLLLHRDADYRSDGPGFRRLQTALGSRARTVERSGAQHVLLGSDACATRATVDWLTAATDRPRC